MRHAKLCSPRNGYEVESTKSTNIHTHTLTHINSSRKIKKNYDDYAEMCGNCFGHWGNPTEPSEFMKLHKVFIFLNYCNRCCCCCCSVLLQGIVEFSFTFATWSWLGLVGFFVGQFTHCGQRNGVCARSLARPYGFRFFAFRSMLAKYLRQCAQKSSSLIIIVEISPAGKAFAACLLAFSQLLRRARIHQLRSSSLPESFVLCMVWGGGARRSVCIGFSWEWDQVWTCLAFWEFPFNFLQA